VPLCDGKSEGFSVLFFLIADSGRVEELLLFFFNRFCTHCNHFFLLPAVFLSLMLIIGCGSTEKRDSTLGETKTGTVPVSDTAAAAAVTGNAVSGTVSADDTAGNDEDTVKEDPGELIENARALCNEGNFAAADSNLKEAVLAIETIDAEAENEWFPSSRYVDDIVSIYSEKMPSRYSIPDEIAMTAFQRQMVRSLDSMKIMPAESLTIATMGCQKNLVYDVPMVWNDRVQREIGRAHV
jgi:hypothetical protein